MKANETRNNPWKGLNYYHEGETLYGRDKETQDLAHYIINNTQTILYGKSGIGKSSIVYAGVFPIARSNGRYPVPIRLKHSGSSSYLSQIMTAFEESGIKKHEILPAVNNEAETLWEFFHRNSFYIDEVKNSVNPLVVFDQFEEIFTLQNDEEKRVQFFSELADLINEITPQYIIDANDNSTKSVLNSSQNSNKEPFSLNFGNGLPDKDKTYLKTSAFHFVFVIREDYLSYLERYTTYIPSMKQNRFPLLPINEKQASEIIMKPIEGLVNEDVAIKIIKKITEQEDIRLDRTPKYEVDSAILSLYLNRLYRISGGQIITNKLVDEKGMNILEDFYDECIRDIDRKDVKTLEDELLINEHRDNQSYQYMEAKLTGKDVLEKLIRRKLLRTFPYGTDTRVEFIHDTICKIVRQHQEQRQLLERQEKEKQKILQEEEQRRLEIEMKAKRLRYIYSAIIACTLLVIGYVTYKYITKEPIPKDKYVDVMFVFNPGKALTGDPWEARAVFSILGDSTYMASVINKKNVNSDSILIKGPMADTVIIRMLMAKMDIPFYVHVASKTEWLCKTNDYPILLKIPKSDELQTVIHPIDLIRDPKATYTLYGWVCSIDGNSINDAFVVFNDKLARTNQYGEFTMTFKDSTELKGSIMYVMKSEFETRERNGEDIIKELRQSNDSTYIIQLNLRDKYVDQYAEEIKQTQSIESHIKEKTFTPKDSDFFMKYFGQGNYEIDKTLATASDTTILYFFQKKSAGNGRIFGMYTIKDQNNNNQTKPFNGYITEIDPLANGHRRWKLSMVAHDSIFNKESLTGTLIKTNVFFDKEN